MNQDNRDETKRSAGLPEGQDAQPESPAAESAAEPERAAARQPGKAGEQKEEQPKKTKEEKPKKRGKLGEYFRSSRFRRGGISTAFTAGFLVIVILLNVITGLLVKRFPSVSPDLTKSGQNSLSEQAGKVVDSVKTPVSVYILADEEQVKNDQVLTDYGVKYSQVGILAGKIAERNSKIKVQYVDLSKNPTFAADNKDQNLQQGDVLFKSDKRSRVLTYSDLFTQQYSADGTSTEMYSTVDSALASALNSVISEALPVAAFDTGHSEQLDSTGYKKLLADNSFETKDFNLLTDKIPEKTQLLVLGCPTTDYTKEEIGKLDAFLSDSSLAGDRSLLVTFHPSQQSMPNLAAFLKEWGLQVPQAVVVESDQNQFFGSDPSNLLSNIQDALNLGGTGDYGYFTMPQTSPVSLLFESQGGRTTYSLAKSNETTYLVDSSTKEGDNPKKEAYNTAALSQETVSSGGKEYKANVIALGSTTMFSSEILSAGAFGNARYLTDLSKYATGTGNSASAVTVTPVQLNAADVTLSAQASTLVGLLGFTILIPLLIAAAGIFVYQRRRHL